MPQITCHPDHVERKHAAGGLCRACYLREWKKRDTPATERWIESNRQRSRDWYKKNKALASLKNAAYKYDISIEEVIELRSKPCEICGSTDELHIDHDHDTGKVRGTLCRTCNLLLGHVEMHKSLKYEELLGRVLAYLDKARLNGKH